MASRLNQIGDVIIGWLYDECIDVYENCFKDIVDDMVMYCYLMIE